MLNAQNERELAYLTTITDITPMDADRLECAHIAGWHCVVGKGEFQPGDIAVFFEIDSKLPDAAPFNEMEFLKSKNYKIKSQKIRGEISQGLLVPISAFGWTVSKNKAGTFDFVTDNENHTHKIDDESRFLTKQLGVTYAVVEDNARKANPMDKYKRMAQRNQKIAKTWWWRKLYKTTFGKKILFFLFGRKKDNKSGWPNWVAKTDEERCQNLPFLFPGDGEEWIATEKVDGSSTSFTMKGWGRRRVFYVCSRNVVMDKPDKKCFYDTNIYTEMAEKYDMETRLAELMEYFDNTDGEVSFVTIQAETYGAGVQKRNYGMENHDMKIFNVIVGYNDGHTRRLNPIVGSALMEEFGLPYVPIVDEHFLIPATCEELLTMAHGVSQIDGEMREGLVFRSKDGVRSFKAVDNEFLLKYHG